jgi:large subunit ribosomal protein L10
MSKYIKQLEMNDLRMTFKGVRDLVLLSAEKLSAGDECAFRANLRKKNVRLKQVKNSLARKVFKELEFQIPDDSPVWKKSTIIAWGPETVKELSQALDSELKNPKTATLYKDKVTIKTAVADGQTCKFEDALKMPTRLEVIGEIVGMILGPASALASCLTGPASQLASQIEKISEKKEESTAAAG